MLIDRLRTGTSTRKLIRQRLATLPLGNAVVLPALNLVLALISPTRRRSLLKKVMPERRMTDPTQHYRNEAARIIRVCKRSTPCTVIVPFDYSVSAPGYGEVFYSAMLAKYFSIHNKHVHFVFVTGNVRTDFQEFFAERELLEKLESFLEIPRVLLHEDYCQVQTMTWTEFTCFLKQYQNTGRPFIPFEDKVLARNPIYNQAFNTINHLMASTSAELRSQFLLTADTILAKVHVNLPHVPYVTWHARYTVQYRQQSNLTEEEFVQIHSRLRALYPQHALMVISDTSGCSHFKKLAQKHGLSCLFSKDYSDSFMGDAALILASSYYFQLRGGGMGVVPIFSALPYEYVGPLANELAWADARLTSWSTDRQIFTKE